MKKICITFFAAALLISCGNKDNKGSAAEENKSAAESSKSAATGMTAEQEKGLDLITKSDCLTCHKVADKSTGPAYTEVAKRYAGKPEMVDTLAQKIIKGGSGNWGTVPMIPHPQISEADAKTMVAYILSINQQ
ncbi:c-type cytochrome [Flavisolibacter ginsenosidimutans]|uniref:C-type cytochrome n=1 Tax=Flavisolibacter ginsenosidimutans TaxID=661481 RepID=A0A5B8UGI0_9BACT|nr:c-type cytochrome [Flavisolibacter ginsenosidimutans]QEC55475.1 c-type cytochrome [Flavisolibacter ginsenosidimutans]